MITHVDEAETSGLWSDQTTAPRSSLTGQDTLPKGSLSFVCTEQPSNLSSRHTDIPGRNVGVGANVLAELSHESIAELANFIVGLALGLEVGTTFTTSDVHYLAVSCQ